MLRWFSRQQKEMLPWYVNGTLNAREHGVVERWLRRSPEALADLADWQRLRTAMAGQAQQTPSSVVWQQVLARVRSRDTAPWRARVLPRLAWAWGGVLVGE
jgi:anti-sigma factor RsiW